MCVFVFHSLSLSLSLSLSHSSHASLFPSEKNDRWPSVEIGKPIFSNINEPERNCKRRLNRIYEGQTEGPVDTQMSYTVYSSREILHGSGFTEHVITAKRRVNNLLPRRDLLKLHASKSDRPTAGCRTPLCRV